MSDDEDIFAEFEEADVEFGSPVEFSGVSASASDSPASQQHPPQPPVEQPRSLRPRTQKQLPRVRQLRMPPPEQPSTSSAPDVFVCSICKKTLKTLEGYQGHLARHSQGQQSGSTSQPIQSKSSSQRQPSSLSPVVAASVCAEKANPLTEDGRYQCQECKSILKTKATFMKHRVAHKMKDANKRKPNVTRFKEEALEDILVAIIQEIISEPLFGDTNGPKLKFLHEFLEKKGHDDWKSFVMELTDFIASVVFGKQKKVLPMNQYEEALKALNSFLNTHDSMLKEKLLKVCDQPISESLAGRLIFRIASKLLEKVQCWMFKEMRNASGRQLLSDDKISMSDAEERGFLGALGSLFRVYYKKGVSHSSKQSQLQSDCIKANFVDGHQPISRHDFLNKKYWMSGDTDCIVPSQHAVQFFKGVEEEVRRCEGEDCTAQGIIEAILEDSALLDHWYFLTNAYFSEDLSLLFMRQLISAYVRMSSQSHELKKNRSEEKSVRATTVALRTHLQHNYIEKDDSKDDCEEEVV